MNGGTQHCKVCPHHETCILRLDQGEKRIDRLEKAALTIILLLVANLAGIIGTLVVMLNKAPM